MVSALGFMRRWDLTRRAKGWAAKAARAAWRELRHRDDATGEEKERLVEIARASPPMSGWCALSGSYVLAGAHRSISRYRGETWIFPRLVWLLGIGMAVAVPTRFLIGESQHVILGEVNFTLVGAFAASLEVVLLFHLVSSSIRLFSTCVRCHIIQRGPDRSITATLSVRAYKLPFIDPASRTDLSPWERNAETYWGRYLGVMLETRKDLSQLTMADIYDESVCWTRPAVSIPPSVKRYAVGKATDQGDITIKERGGFGGSLMWQPRLDFITISGAILATFAGTLLATIIGILLVAAIQAVIS